MDRCGPAAAPATVLPPTSARMTSKAKMGMCSLLVGNASHERLKWPSGHSYADRPLLLGRSRVLFAESACRASNDDHKRCNEEFYLARAQLKDVYVEDVCVLGTAAMALLMAVSRRRSDVEQGLFFWREPYSSREDFLYKIDHL